MADSNLPGRDPKTIEKNRYVLEPLLTVIGTIRLRDLDVTDVDKALAAVAATRSGSTMITQRSFAAVAWAVLQRQDIFQVARLRGKPDVMSTDSGASCLHAFDDELRMTPARRRRS